MTDEDEDNCSNQIVEIWGSKMITIEINIKSNHNNNKNKNKTCTERQSNKEALLIRQE